MQRAVCVDAGSSPPRDPEPQQGWKLGQETRQPIAGNSADKKLARGPNLALHLKSASLEGGSDLTVATNAIRAGASRNLTHTQLVLVPGLQCKKPFRGLMAHLG